MDSSWVPLISGLVGAIIGAFGTVVTVWLQLRSQDRRERIRQAAALASEDRALIREIAREEGRVMALPPMSLFVSHYLEALKLMEGDGLTREAMRKLQAKHDDLYEFALELEKERRKNLRERET